AIAKEVDKKITRRQQEYFLMEQPKGIKKELGMDSDGEDKLVEKFTERSLKLKMPEAVKKVFEEVCVGTTTLCSNIGLFTGINQITTFGEPAASEFNVTRNYLDWLTQIPAGKRSKENLDIPHATVLHDPYGIKDVKKSNLELIAVAGTIEGKLVALLAMGSSLHLHIH
ncbi:ATP-dependent Lon protease pim1, partial [Blyttiomyces sp. JEL0837]